MIVLDTNVLSEVLRPAPDPRPLAWLAAQTRADLFTTTVDTSRVALRRPTACLPAQRRDGLLEAVQAVFASDMVGQVLSFDNAAADLYAEIAAARKLAGRPISQFDAMIAAIARSRGADLATRNVRDFIGCGVQVIDPWQA